MSACSDQPESDMKVLSVLAHPRRSSLTGAAFDRLNLGLREAGHSVTEADLTAEGFDPRLALADEPEWDNPDTPYSPAVQAEMARLRAHEGIVMTFPVWWWSVPALLKGWIDRVWNRGFAYGHGRSLAGRKALMIGLAGSGEQRYDGPDRYREAMEIQLVQGVLRYCGIEDGRLVLMTQSRKPPERRAEILAEVEALGRGFSA